jgi:hypothetical protein
VDISLVVEDQNSDKITRDGIWYRNVVNTVDFQFSIDSFVIISKLLQKFEFKPYTYGLNY